MQILRNVDNQKIYFGDNLTGDLNYIIGDENLANKKILLITGLSSMDESLWVDDFFDILKSNSIVVKKRVQVSPNPVLDDIERFVHEDGIDYIFCVGGGSVIDFGKMLKLKHYKEAKIFALYTLPGSGSIVTPFAIYNNDKFKVGEYSEQFVPNLVYVNSLIINSLSLDKKIFSICDITAHAIESFFSTQSDNTAKWLAKKALVVLKRHIADLEKIPAKDFIEADINAALAESRGLVLFPHAAGHYLTYKFNIIHPLASIYYLKEFLELLLIKGVDVPSDYAILVGDLVKLLRSKNLLPDLKLEDEDVDAVISLIGEFMNFAYANSPIEISLEEYRKLLLSRNNNLQLLNNTIKQALNAQLYADRLTKYSEGLRSVGELSSLPFTTKSDLREAYPLKSLAIDFKKVIEMHTTSGTTGKPTLSFYSKKDLDLGSDAIAECWANFGITNNSRVQFIMSYGLFSGAMLNTYAIQKLGAFVLPAGIQSTSKQVDLMIDFEIDTLVATPGFLLYLANYIEEHNIPREKFKIIRAIAAGEIYSNKTRKAIEERLGIKVYDHYGLCEVNTGIAYECDNRDGLHILDDYVIAEIIDPKTEKLLPDGEYGELVLTSLKKEASPMIRYRTGDITCIKKGRCSCGSHKTRIDRIQRRVDDILFIRGLKINPHEIKDFVFSYFNDSVRGGDMRILVKNNSIDFLPKIFLSLKDNVEHMISDLIIKLKDKTGVLFDVQNIGTEYFNRENNNKVKLVEYVE